jgi:hypothetical protein
MKIKYALLWLALWPIAILNNLICRVLSPIACLFIKRTLEKDVVKRLDKNIVILPRDNLISIFKGFNTHDNNTDEWWYGMYNVDHFWYAKKWTQKDYDNSKLIRWYCRCMWLQRNSGYSFAYWWISRYPTETIEIRYTNIMKLTIRQDSFQAQIKLPLAFGFYNDINIGWKAHKKIEKLSYAGRILGIRKY